MTPRLCDRRLRQQDLTLRLQPIVDVVSILVATLAVQFKRAARDRSVRGSVKPADIARSLGGMGNTLSVRRRVCFAISTPPGLGDNHSSRFDPPTLQLTPFGQWAGVDRRLSGCVSVVLTHVVVHWKLDDERGACAQTIAVNRHGSAMQFDYVVDDCQPQAEPATRTMHRAASLRE